MIKLIVLYLIYIFMIHPIVKTIYNVIAKNEDEDDEETGFQNKLKS